jgi:hypothetical protein
MTTATAKTTKAAYNRSAIAAVFHKYSGELLGYIAEPSQPRNADGSAKPWHQLTEDLGEWSCTCDGCAVWGYECRHLAALHQLLDAQAKASEVRADNETVAALTELFETFAEPEQVEAVQEETTTVEETPASITEIFESSAPVEEPAPVAVVPAPAAPVKVVVVAAKKPAPTATKRRDSTLSSAYADTSWLNILPSRQVAS